MHKKIIITGLGRRSTRKIAGLVSRDPGNDTNAPMIVDGFLPAIKIVEDQSTNTKIDLISDGGLGHLMSSINDIKAEPGWEDAMILIVFDADKWVTKKDLPASKLVLPGIDQVFDEMSMYVSSNNLIPLSITTSTTTSIDNNGQPVEGPVTTVTQDKTIQYYIA